MNNHIRGLFLNSPEAQCSIHESGIMVYNAIKSIPWIKWDYEKLSEKIFNTTQSIYQTYNLVFFNYHPYTAPWLCLDSIKEIKCLKINMVLETLPNDIFSLCPRDVFDLHLAIDPTIKDNGKDIYGMPRPIANQIPDMPTYSKSSKIRIGTFGFATPGKGFEKVVDAVNREFDEAEIRINIPTADFADFATKNLHKINYAKYLLENMKMIAKPGVEIIATDIFMTQIELVKWCRDNDINIFLYDRDQPGLSATTDQAIASGRPLLVSDNSTFRHIHQFLKPYPFLNIKQSLIQSVLPVREMQNRWSKNEFNIKFDKILQQNRRHLRKRHRVLLARKSENLKKMSKFRQLISQLKKIKAGCLQSKKIFIPNIKIESERIQLLMVNSAKKNCGVYQYGKNIFSEISKIKDLRTKQVDVADQLEYEKAVSENEPVIILFNHYPFTMPWLKKEIVKGSNAIKLGILHEMNDQIVSDLNNDLFNII